MNHGGYHTEDRKMDHGLGGFVRHNYHEHEVRRAWWTGFMAALAAITFAVGFGMLLAFLSAPAHAQTPAPAQPTSYAFKFSPEEGDALYLALRRASQEQANVTGDRSPRFDALADEIVLAVGQQKAAAAKAAAPKDEAPAPKPEAKP